MTQENMGRPLVGVAWMVLSGVFFIGVNTIVRYLGTDLPAQQSAFIRFAWSVVFTIPAIWQITKMQIAPATWKMICGRGVVHAVAVSFWFFAMARIPLAEVTAIGYLTPVLVTVGAALFFGERLALRRMLAIGVALIGTLIVLRPGLRELVPGHLAQIAAATFFAGSYLFAKRLTGQLPPGLIVAFMSLATTVMLAPMAIYVWEPLQLSQLVWLGVVAMFATCGHYFMMRAFAVAPVSVTQPVTFLQLVWATLTGAMLFGEAIDIWVILGGTLIVAAVSYIAWRESVLRRAKG